MEIANPRKPARNSAILFVAAGLLLAGPSAQAVFVEVANDTLTWSDAEIVASDAWNNADTTFEYTVWADFDNQQWKYQYTLNVSEITAGGGISHVIIETSPNFTEGNFLDGTTPYDDIMTHPGLEEPNPGMPENMYGIKWNFDDVFPVNPPSDRSFTVEVISDRAPIWGDFYAKGGNADAYNSGFTDVDPALDVEALLLAQALLEADHILVPDTITGVPIVPVPLPAAAWLLGSALVMLGVVCRRRR